jgi:hypothetical protein
VDQRRSFRFRLRASSPPRASAKRRVDRAAINFVDGVPTEALEA